MAHTAWPVITDIDAAYASAGLTPPSAAREQMALDAAIDMWNRGTGYIPFLAVSATIPFDPPGGGSSLYAAQRGGGNLLRLPNGLVSVSALSVGGVSRVENTDFFLKPFDAPAKLGPFEIIEFNGPVFGTARSISITGVWGYSLTIPDSAWYAVLELACAMCIPEVEMLLTPGGVLKWNIRDKGETLADEPLKALKAWTANAMLALGMFKRVVSYV